MNSTFMFGEDNFSESEDFSIYYYKIGGKLAREYVNNIIWSVYSYLNDCYPDEKYRNCFPSVEVAIKSTANKKLSELEIQNLVKTFAHHELGTISSQYCQVLQELRQKVKLALVIDIWAPKTSWVALFNELEIMPLFSVSSFSSDHGMVKPSPRPFEWVLAQLGAKNEQALMVGDSVRRDLGGAQAAEIDCVLVGGAEHQNALASYENLIEFSKDFLSQRASD